MAGVVTVMKAAREGGAVWGVAVDSGGRWGEKGSERKMVTLLYSQDR